MLIHLTTNLTASELESIYGNRIRSRMRDMFNLVAFDKDAKRKKEIKTGGMVKKWTPSV